MGQGWKCPNCGGAHGPHVDSCPVKTAQPTPSPLPIQPGLIPVTIPREWYPDTRPACDPVTIWPYTTCEGITCKPDPNLIVWG